MKTYPIFLASSFELKPEREKFGNFIRRQNDRLAKKNVRLKLEIWEDMDVAFNKGSKQGDYNDRLKEAEIVVVLFWTKMGKYTRQEFELAYQRFLDSEEGRPLVYVYEKTVTHSRETEEWEKESIAEFKNRLLTEGKEQFHYTFDHYSVLESHFLQTIHDLFDKNELTFGKMAERHSLKAPFLPSLVIGRDRELETISEKFKNKGQVILISAEGGMGKTTLASKYWQENRYTYNHCAYLFCEEGILKAMTDDGIGLDLQGLDDAEKTRQLQRKLSVLADDFLLFLDNANNAADIVEFLKVFPGYNWNVLITSRSRDVLANKSDEINLTHLDPEDAKALFQTFYSEDNGDFEVLLERLLKAIHYHTLVIEVFAKNLKEASEMGTDLKSFLNGIEEKGLILDVDDNFEVNTVYDDSVQKQAATTNDILEILYDFSKLAEPERYMLVNLALLPSDNYSLKFLMDLFEPEDKRAFRDCLKSLYRKGWVGGADDLYKLSPVIQHLVIHRNQHLLLEDGKDLLKKMLALMEYEHEKENAHVKFKWIPYGMQLARIYKVREDGDYALFLNYLGNLLRQLGGKENLLIAKAHLEKALALSLKNFGEVAPGVAISRSNLALVLSDLGGENNLLEAKYLLEKSLGSDLANFGEHSTSVSISRSNLGLVLRKLGGKDNLLEAKGYLENALTADLAYFGEVAIVVAIRRSNLGLVLKDLGGEKNLLEAKNLLEKALNSDLSNFEENDPPVARSRSNLAGVLRDLGGENNLLEAKAYLEEALKSGIRNFGEDAPVVALISSSMATVLQKLGDEENLMEAKAYLEKALESDIRNFGQDSDVVAKRRSNLALVLQDLGGEKNLLEAKDYLVKSLASDLANFGEDAHKVANSRFNLALIYQDLGEKYLLEAKDHLEKCLVSYLANNGEDAAFVSTIRTNLGSVLSNLGGEKNLLEAKAHLEKSLAWELANLGEEATSVATIHSNLAFVLKVLGGESNLLEAKAHLEKSLASEISNVGEGAPLVSTIRLNLVMVLQDLGGNSNLMEAKGHLEKSLASDIVNFGEEALSVAISRSDLALILQDLGSEENLLEAKALLEKSLASYILNFGENIHSVATIFSNLAMVLLDLGGKSNLLNAKGHLEKALEQVIRNFGEEDPAVALFSYNLALVLVEIGARSDLEEAKKLMESAKKSYLNQYGEDHPTIKIVQSTLDNVNTKLEKPNKGF